MIRLRSAERQAEEKGRTDRLEEEGGDGGLGSLCVTADRLLMGVGFS